MPGGYLRTMLFHLPRAVLEKLSIAPDERGGTYLQVDSARGEIRLWKEPPLHLRQLQGELSLRNALLRYRATGVRLPGSRFTSAGVIDLSGAVPRYDLGVEADSADLADLQWLYPPLPDTGRASFRFWLETHPDGELVQVRALRLRTPDTRLTGNFSVLLGDTLRFGAVDLTADPLGMETVRRMLPGGLPVQGLHIGSVRVESPAPAGARLTARPNGRTLAGNLR